MKRRPELDLPRLALLRAIFALLLLRSFELVCDR